MLRSRVVERPLGYPFPRNDGDEAGGSFGRSALERLLGAGLFFFTDSSGEGRHGHIRWDCGCVAEEASPDRFRMSACTTHAETMKRSR